MPFLFLRKTSSPGSKIRRMWTLASLALCAVLIAENFSPVFVDDYPLIEMIGAIIFVLWAIAYFCLVVIAIPFLTSQNFWPNPIRLAQDTLVSAALTILTFAVCYRLLGIIGPEPDVSPWSHVYFSTVTFSTLGYGDFRPDTGARGLAALQAIIGNLHLGMVVGVAFFAVSPEPTKRRRIKRPLQPQLRRRRKGPRT